VSTPTIGVPTVSADHVVAHNLLNCYVREIGPGVLDGDHLSVALPGTGRTLRIEVRRRSLAGAHRFTGPAFTHRGGDWVEASWREVADLVAAELSAATGVVNDEFAGQVAASHEVTATALRRPPPEHPDRYLASEQALPLGHRFHPTPKARTAAAGDWRDCAPETGSRVAPRLLAVPVDLVREAGDVGAIDALHPVPDGHRLLPVHPWQFDLLRADIAACGLIDLDAVGPLCTPTSSVRTLHGPTGFLKFSLNVRITNCVRRNADHELASAVALTALVDRAGLPVRVLREPGYRTVDVPGLREGLGVIVRDDVTGYLPPGTTPLLAAAVADEYPRSAAHVSRLAGADPLGWWAAYLRLLVAPVLETWLVHGVVLEPHLQNVLVCVTDDGLPVRLLFRDLEGTKLDTDRHAATLAALPSDVAASLAYTREQAWRRVAYCLLVNHIAEFVAALADPRPDLEADLWALVRAELAGLPVTPPEVAAVLAGGPVPAKANLLARWRRTNDRGAGYVPVRLPLAVS
jgi:siderophore synthetase component